MDYLTALFLFLIFSQDESAIRLLSKLALESLNVIDVAYVGPVVYKRTNEFTPL